MPTCRNRVFKPTNNPLIPLSDLTISWTMSRVLRTSFLCAFIKLRIISPGWLVTHDNTLAAAAAVTGKMEIQT